MTEAVYVETTVLLLDQLAPYPGNARRGDVEAILGSLKRNGQYRSLIARQTGADGPHVVLAGNHTLQALALHGAGPCDYTAGRGKSKRPCGLCHGKIWSPSARVELVTCDDTTAARINLIDNRAADLGDYDTSLLAELLAGLDGDLEGTGYTEADLEGLLGDDEPHPPDEFPDFDDDIETNRKCPQCGYEWQDNGK